MRKWLTERWFLKKVFWSGSACGLLVGLAFSGVLNGSEAQTNDKPTEPLPGQINPIQTTAPKAPNLPSLKKGEPLPANLFVELAKIINPATVNIFTTTTLGPRNFGGRPMPRDPFFDLFEQFSNPGLPPPKREAQALGTGFIISSDGLIVTNNHVVEGADKVKVMVQIDEKNEKSYEASIVGTHRRTDLALLKIEPTQSLVVAQLGSSKDLEVGEWVAAFGNPVGLGHTMTKGIISAKNRPIDELNRFPFLQTDASINPGNSGGPLVNTKGLVIGVNAAVAAGGVQGIGFAIPIDEAKPIIAQLQKTGSIKQGYIGVGLEDLTPQAAQYFGLDSLNGVLISEVLPSGPAARAGIQRYDILLKFGEKKIGSSADLVNSVSDASIGSKQKVTLLREGRQRVVTVEVGENPFEPTRRRQEPRKQYQGQKAPLNLGFKMADLNEPMRRELGVDRDLGQRAVVIEIEQGSLAARANLQVGDVILDVNQHDVHTSSDVIRRLHNGQNSLRVARPRGVALIFLNVKEK